MQLGSCIAVAVAVAVAVAGSCSSDLTPSLGTSMCHGAALKSKKQTNKTKNKVIIDMLGLTLPFSYFLAILYFLFTVLPLTVFLCDLTVFCS